jgi:hypothetical protein
VLQYALKIEPIGMVRTKKRSSSKKTRRSWYHALDTKHVQVLANLGFEKQRGSLQKLRFKPDEFLKVKIFEFSQHLLTPSTLVSKCCLFLRNEINSPPSNFTGNTMKSISIDWYTETSAFMLYAAVNAARSS